MHVFGDATPGIVAPVSMCHSPKKASLLLSCSPQFVQKYLLLMHQPKVAWIEIANNVWHSAGAGDENLFHIDTLDTLDRAAVCRSS